MSTVDSRCADSRYRVVVTGMGVVSPVGHSLTSFWQSLLAGKLGTRAITKFDTTDFLTNQGGEVTDFDPAPYIKRINYQNLPRSAQFAVAATTMALADAALLDSCSGSTRVGVCFGT